MLVLSRKENEKIVIGGLGGFESTIKVTVVRAGGKVRLGIEAPADITVHRLEVWERIQAEKRLAKATARSSPPTTHHALAADTSSPAEVTGSSDVSCHRR